MHRWCCLLVTVPPQTCHQQATSSVHYITNCKHSVGLLRMGELIAQSMLKQDQLQCGYHQPPTWSAMVKETVQLYLYCYSVDITSHPHRAPQLTLILLTWRIRWASNNTSKWQMRLNSTFKGLDKQYSCTCTVETSPVTVWISPAIHIERQG